MRLNKDLAICMKLESYMFPNMAVDDAWDQSAFLGETSFFLNDRVYLAILASVFLFEN